MKKTILFLFVLFLIFVTACGSSTPTDTKSPDAPENSGQESNQSPRPTPTTLNNNTESNSSFESYPAAPPTATPFPEGYPAPKVVPTHDPYPGDKKENTTWILFPVGIQCEDADGGIKYKNEKDAEAGLTAAGINVHQVTTTELMVCTACGCPTSAHYRAEINESDLNKAVTLEWIPEQN